MAYIQQLSCSTDTGLGPTAKIGLIVLQTDQTIEHEFRQLLNIDGVACYHSRIANAMAVTPLTLAQMAADLPVAASLLPSEFEFDAIGYACTSGATVIGEGAVATAIQQHHPNAKISNPLTACKAACGALGLTRIALLTPYTPEVTQALADNLQGFGIHIVTTGYFNLEDDFTVGRVTSVSILESVLELGQNPDCDGVFVSCTSLRVAGVIAQAESMLGKPVISSNQALAWHLLSLAGVAQPATHFGGLFQHKL